MLNWFRSPTDRGLYLFLLLLSALAALVVSLGDVRAQGRGERLARLLAQTCVAEISFQHSTRECKIMWKINAKNAVKKRRGQYLQTKLFNGHWGDNPESARLRAARPWIANLSDGRRPRHWPRRLRWEAHRAIWLRYLEAAREHVRRPFSDPDHCPGAVDYGAPGEVPRGNLVLIDCGDTLQRYWAERKKTK